MSSLIQYKILDILKQINLDATGYLDNFENREITSCMKWAAVRTYTGMQLKTPYDITYAVAGIILILL